jgi:hypothetical protein
VGFLKYYRIVRQSAPYAYNGKWDDDAHPVTCGEVMSWVQSEDGAGLNLRAAQLAARNLYFTVVIDASTVHV